MKDSNEQTYGERIADVYDRFYPEVDISAIDLLEELSQGGEVLELGIGTGRIALPLHQRGVRIKGIDASPAMIEKLLGKPGGSEIEVVQGNFVDVPIEGRFSLIFIAFNTLYGLLTQAQQIQCLRSAAAHLSDDGLFLVEAFVPDLTRFTRGQNLSVVDMDEGQVRIDVATHDPVRQQVTSQHLLLTENGVRMFPVTLRYIWPSELDLMAHIAELQLRHRWGGWKKEPFNAGSGRHISVYARFG